MARQFDGAGNDYTIGDMVSPLENFNSSANSFSIWINPDSDGAGSTGRFFNAFTSTTSRNYALGHAESGGSMKMQTLQDCSTSFDAANSDATEIQLGVWNLVQQKDGGVVGTDGDMYVDGVDVAQTSVGDGSGSRSDATGNFVVGDRATGGRSYDGDMGYCVFWSSELTDNQFLALFHGVNPIAIDPDNLILFLTNEGNSTPILNDGDWNGQLNKPSAESGPPSKSTTNPPVELLENYLSEA